MRRTLMTGLALLWMTIPAAATGGFGCEIDDANLKLEVVGTTGRGMGTPIIGIMAKAEIKLKGAPADFASIDLENAMQHHWLASPDLRLHFYHERTGNQPHAGVEIVIKTVSVPGEEITYEGDYTMDIFLAEPPKGVATKDGVIKAIGKVTCAGG